MGSVLVIAGKLLHWSSIPFAELIGAWSGIKYLITHYHTPPIWIQGDSSVVISWLQKLQYNCMTLTPWMQDIKLWLTRFPQIKISHICREGNQATDWAAPHALSGDFAFNSNMLCYHPDLVHILKADAYSIAYPCHGQF